MATKPRTKAPVQALGKAVRSSRRQPKALALDGGGRGAARSAGKGVTARSSAKASKITEVRKPQRQPMALALAGGGPLGAIYELGALLALSEALEGVDFNAMDMYVGVSSGSFIAAGLANGLTADRMRQMFIESDTAAEPIAPEVLLNPAFKEYAQRALSLPTLFLSALFDYVAHPFDQHFLTAFQRLSQAIPIGVFSGTGIHDTLSRLFAAPGRSNDFRKLKHRLFVVATDLDSGNSVEFGMPGRDAVPISTAVQASAALPGLFPPVEINGRHYVDGALKKTLHASVALKEGAKLVLCINPLVPFDADLAQKRGAGRHYNLVDGGLPLVLSQTFRALIHSRMQVGMGKYGLQYPDADVVLFEPSSDDAEMFFANIFSYASRGHLCEHAYQKTRIDLYRRRHELKPILARHGVSIRLDVLKETRSVLRGTPAVPMGDILTGTVQQLALSLDALEHWLAEQNTP